MAQETFLQSEEDMQRMIELGAWYGGDEESSAAIVETDSEIETNYNRNEVLNTIKYHTRTNDLSYLVVAALYGSIDSSFQ